MKRIRNAFVTGLLVLVPLMATIDILKWFVRSVDNTVRDYLPPFLNWIDFKGLGLITAVVTILVVGAMTQNYAGKWVVNLLDHVVRRIGIVGGIYSAIKKFLETIFNPRSDKFNGVVLVPFPREGMYSIGFRTGEPDHNLQKKEKHLVNVFVPCTPNPTSSGFLSLGARGRTHPH